MNYHSDDLAAVSEERTAPPPEFALAQDVIDTAATWPLNDQRRLDMICHQAAAGRRRCGQVVIPIAVDGEMYEYTDEERDSLVIAHLIQRHGWTRESVGERPAAAR